MYYKGGLSSKCCFGLKNLVFPLRIIKKRNTVMDGVIYFDFLISLL